MYLTSMYSQFSEVKFSSVAFATASQRTDACNAARSSEHTNGVVKLVLLGSKHFINLKVYNEGYPVIYACYQR